MDPVSARREGIWPVLDAITNDNSGPILVTKIYVAFTVFLTGRWPVSCFPSASSVFAV